MDKSRNPFLSDKLRGVRLRLAPHIGDIDVADLVVRMSPSDVPVNVIFSFVEEIAVRTSVLQILEIRH